MADSQTQEKVREAIEKLRGVCEYEANLGVGMFAVADLRTLLAAYTRMEAEVDRLRTACSKLNAEVCDVLGRALGYPWFKDDQANFPGATEADGVCVGDHVAESLADEAAAKIVALKADMAEARKLMKPAVKNARLADRVLASDGERMSLTVGELRVLAAFYNKGEG